MKQRLVDCSAVVAVEPGANERPDGIELVVRDDVGERSERGGIDGITDRRTPLCTFAIGQLRGRAIGQVEVEVEVIERPLLGAATPVVDIIVTVASVWVVAEVTVALADAEKVLDRVVAATTEQVLARELVVAEASVTLLAGPRRCDPSDRRRGRTGRGQGQECQREDDDPGQRGPSAVA